MGHDDIDVQFADRVYTGNRDWVGNRMIDKKAFDCGINIKYANLKKVAQLEIRVGYVLPSGDIEGLTWAKLRRKQRQLVRNIAKCCQYQREITSMIAQQQRLASSGTNMVERTVNAVKIDSLSRTINRYQRFTSRHDEFKSDLAAFAGLNEYLKTKIHGCQVYVHFHHAGKTLPVDLAELKRSRIRPIQVFEYAKDPIQHPREHVANTALNGM
jgi:hypothetical protein